jgi:hypothetical protein
MNSRKLFSAAFLFILQVPFALYGADDSVEYNSSILNETTDPDGAKPTIEYFIYDQPSDVRSEDIIHMDMNNAEQNMDYKQAINQDRDYDVQAKGGIIQQTITCNPSAGFAECATSGGGLSVRNITWHWENFELVFPKDQSNTLIYTNTITGQTGVLDLELYSGTHRLIDTCWTDCGNHPLFSRVFVKATNQAGDFVALATFKRASYFTGMGYPNRNTMEMCLTTDPNFWRRYRCVNK